MAAVNVDETTERGGGGDHKGDTQYRRSFLVRTDDVDDGPFTARIAVGVPRIGDAHDDDPNAVCVKIDVRTHEDWPNDWDVTCEYSSKVEDVSENPLDRRSVETWSVERYQEVLERDRAGTVICNSSRRPFEPAIQVEAGRLKLSISRNEPIFDDAKALDYLFKLNSDVWRGYDPGTVRCDGISGREGFENRTLFYSVTYEFSLRPGGWALSILDQGFDELPEPDVWRTITDRRGQPVSQPVLLDGGGLRLGSAGVPFFHAFVAHGSEPFADLNLP